MSPRCRRAAARQDGRRLCASPPAPAAFTRADAGRVGGRGVSVSDLIHLWQVVTIADAGASAPQCGQLRPSAILCPIRAGGAPSLAVSVDNSFGGKRAVPAFSFSLHAAPGRTEAEPCSLPSYEPSCTASLALYSISAALMGSSEPGSAQARLRSTATIESAIASRGTASVFHTAS